MSMPSGSTSHTTPRTPPGSTPSPPARHGVLRCRPQGEVALGGRQVLEPRAEVGEGEDDPGEGHDQQRDPDDEPDHLVSAPADGREPLDFDGALAAMEERFPERALWTALALTPIALGVTGLWMKLIRRRKRARRRPSVDVSTPST